MYEKKIDDSSMRFVFERATRSGIPNCNGVTYSKEVFDKWKKNFDHNIAVDPNFYPVVIGILDGDFNIVSVQDIVGFVESISDTFIVIKAVNNKVEDFNSLLKIKGEKVVVAMNINCDFTFENLKSTITEIHSIPSFSLVPKSSSPSTF